jgi:3-dehydroquinate dehydratase/shikimate dehydrogenase
MLGVALGPRDTNSALASYEALRERADIIELRLDLMDGYDLKTLVTKRPLPLVVTNRPVREGGRYEGDETRRVAVLLQALDLGAEYIDIELDAVQLVPESYRHRVVVSHHDFERMPPDLDRTHQDLAASGMGTMKIVGMARRPEDSLAVLRIFERSTAPTIGIAMGPHGLISRVLALRYDNCFLTYGTAVAGEEVAPGQLALSTLTDVYRAREIGAGTAAFGVVVDQTEDVLLADLNSLLRQRGADAVAVPLARHEATPATLAAFAEFGFEGFWDVANGTVRGGADLESEETVEGVEQVAERWAGMLLERS